MSTEIRMAPVVVGVAAGVLLSMTTVAVCECGFSTAAVSGEFRQAELWAAPLFWLREWGPALAILALLLVLGATKALVS